MGCAASSDSPDHASFEHHEQQYFRSEVHTWSHQETHFHQSTQQQQTHSQQNTHNEQTSSPNKSPTPIEKMEEIRLVLIGKTGAGKSETGNTILGKVAFESYLRYKSVTTNCNIDSCIRENRKIVLVDTPGMMDTDQENAKTVKEIVQCIGLSSPGPHAILLVISTATRFTAEDRQLIRTFIHHFGKDIYKFLVVVFTHGDELRLAKITIEEYLGDFSTELKSLVEKCGNRYLAFDNFNQPKDQVNELLDIVSKNMQNNPCPYYTNEMYAKAEQKLKEAMEANMQRERSKKEKELQEVRQIAVEADRSEMEKKIEAKYAQKLTEEFQREMVRRQVQNNGWTMDSIKDNCGNCYFPNMDTS